MLDFDENYLGQVNVNDCLSSSMSVSYHLIEENSSALTFSIDAESGRIQVIGELDREIQAFYTFHIASFNDKVEIQINILDKNDHSPIFNTSDEQYIYIPTNHHPPIFITNLHATDADVGLNGLVHYYFTNKDHYAYFHIYSNGSLIFYNSLNIYLPIRLEISARDYGSPQSLYSKDNLIIYLCDISKRNECSSNTFRRNIYLASILIMISIVTFLLMIILCIFWNVFLKKQMRREDRGQVYNCRIEGRKNLSKKIFYHLFSRFRMMNCFLVVSDHLSGSSPTLNGNQRLKCVMV